MIYVINSARRGLPVHVRADFALSRHVLLICDECHRYKSRHNYKIFDFLKEDGCSGEADAEGKNNAWFGYDELYHCLGLSATPFNGNGDEKLIRALGPEIYKYDLYKAGQDNTIARYAVCQVAADFNRRESLEYAELSDSISKAYGALIKSAPHLRYLDKDRFLAEVSRMAKQADMDPEDPAAAFLILTYRRKEISVMAESRIRCCIDLMDLLLDRGKIILFSERIDQAEQIYSIMQRRYGCIAGLYHSGMSREARKRVLEEFRRGVTRVLVSCKCLDEGIDVPDACIGIVVSGSSVSRQRIQRLGRIVRSSEGKDSACLYYIYMRGTTDSQAYLPGSDSADDMNNTFDLRYCITESAGGCGNHTGSAGGNTEECGGIFINDLYEYAANMFLKSTESRLRAGETGPGSNAQSGAVMMELRRCILEGICMPDYLLSSEVLNKRIKAEADTHTRNYFTVMKQIHKYFITED